MKTKAQKRLEVIQRLERDTIRQHDVVRGIPQGDGTVKIESYQETLDRRHAEAQRLREAFKL